jgi:hypothetical protein
MKPTDIFTFTSKIPVEYINGMRKTDRRREVKTNGVCL